MNKLITITIAALILCGCASKLYGIPVEHVSPWEALIESLWPEPCKPCKLTGDELAKAAEERIMSLWDIGNKNARLKYKDYDCTQIALEKQQVERQTTKLYHGLQKERTKDNWQVGLGFFTGGLAFLLVEGGDGPAAAEYAQLKGEYEALQDNAIAKKCELDFQQTN